MATYYAEVQTNYVIYAHIGGAWTQVASGVWGDGQYYGTGGAKTVTFNRSITITTTSTIDHFRIVIDAGANINSASVQWTTTSSASERSATPNGEIVKATMRPN